VKISDKIAYERQSRAMRRGLMMLVIGIVLFAIGLGCIGHLGGYSLFVALIGVVIALIGLGIFLNAYHVRRDMWLRGK